MITDKEFELEVGQRQQPRVPFSRRAALHIDGIPGSVAARIINLSARGAFLRAERLPPVGASVLCRFVVGAEEAVLRCRVRWIDLGWRPGLDIGPGAGVEFVGLGRDERARLQMLVAETPTPVPLPRTH